MLVLLAATVPCGVSAREGGNVALPVSSAGWSVSGAEARIEPAPEGFVVHYRSPNRSPVRVRFPDPVLIPQNTARLQAWYAPIAGDSELSFLINDSSGTIHRLGQNNSQLEPRVLTYDRKRARTWPLWTKTESINLRTPSAEEIHRRLLLPGDAEAALKMRWPQPLYLVGIEVIPAKSRWSLATSKERQKQIDEGVGSVAVRNIEACMQHSREADFYGVIIERMRWARDEPAYLFPDELTPVESGPFGYQVEIFRGYNGPLVWAKRGRMVLDRTDAAALFANRVALPRVRPGTYVVRINNYRDNGARVSSEEFNWLVGRGEDRLDGADRPALQWETGRERHVFPCDAAVAQLRLHLDPKMVRTQKEHAVCRFIVMDATRTVYQENTHTLADELVFDFPGTPGHDYYATAQILRGDRVLEEQVLHFGFASPPVDTEAPLPALPPDLPSLEEFVTGRAHLHPQYRMYAGRTVTPEYPHFVNIDYDDVARWAELAGELGAESVSFKAGWLDLEPLPGVWRWEVLDKCVRIIAEKKRKIVFSKSPMGRQRVPRWLDSLPMRDQYGDFRIDGGEIFPLDPEASAGWTGLWSAVARHYRQNPNVIGWRIASEMFFGTPNPESTVTDYSPQAQAAYDEWRIAQGLELKPLPELLALPGVSVAKLGPDVSPDWIDFTRFRSESLHTSLRKCMEALRAIDSQRMIWVERRAQPSAVEGLIPDLKKYGAALKSEGAPNFDEASLHSMCIQDGVPYLEELHRHVPSSRSIADACNFWTSYLQNGAFWLSTWNSEYLDGANPKSFVGNFPETFRFLQQTQSVWEEYCQAKYVEPQVLILGSRIDQLVSGHRRGFYRDIAGRETHSALFQTHQVPVHFANEYADWVDLNRFKLLFVCGEVLPQHSVNRILAYAKQGGKVVFVGNAGRYITQAAVPGKSLTQLLSGLPDIRTVPEPAEVPSAGGNSGIWQFDERKIDELLVWADIQRPARVAAEGPPGFQVQVRVLPDGKTFYAAVMRSWYGNYRGNVEAEEDLRKQYGSSGGRLTINAPGNGPWHVTKIHRDPKELGSFHAENGRLTFAMDPAAAGEVQIYRFQRDE